MLHLTWPKQVSHQNTYTCTSDNEPSISHVFIVLSAVHLLSATPHWHTYIHTHLAASTACQLPQHRSHRWAPHPLGLQHPSLACSVGYPPHQLEVLQVEVHSPHLQGQHSTEYWQGKALMGRATVCVCVCVCVCACVCFYCSKLHKHGPYWAWLRLTKHNNTE